MLHSNVRGSYVSRISRYLLPAVTVTMGIQLLNIFMPSLAWYLRDTMGVATLQLLPYAFAPFLLGFLAAALRRLAGDRASLWITAGGVALFRLVEQLSRNSAIDLWLSVVGLALFLMFIPVFIGHTRALGAHTTPRWLYGFALGFALDISLRAVFGFRQLSSATGLLPFIIIALLTALTLLMLWREPISGNRSASDVAWGSAFSLAAVGPYAVLQVLIYGSHGYLGEVAGIGPALSFALIMLGYFSACVGISWGFARPHALHPLIALVITAYLAVSIYLVDQSGASMVLSLLLGQGLVGWGLAVIGRANAKGGIEGLFRTTLMAGSGMLLFLVLVFGYYVAQDIALPVPRAVFPAAASAIVGLLFLSASSIVRSKPATTSRHVSALIAAGVLLFIPLGYWIFADSSPAEVEPTGENVRVMSYNIHSGFNLHGQQDLEAIAAVIEESGADVVALQEVSRVRFMDASADLPNWLAQRLDMHYVFRGTEEPIWGNAILSRYPIVESGWGDLPRAGMLIGRGYLWARVDVGGPDPVLVIDTHLHHLGPDTLARQEQVPDLLKFWNDQAYSVLLGDLNAGPGSPEMELIAAAGLQDAWRLAGEGLGYTYTSGNPVKRIDWIWHTDDMSPLEMEVVQTQASDHMPVLAVFELE